MSQESHIVNHKGLIFFDEKREMAPLFTQAVSSYEQRGFL